jgi:hypothetical protein
MIYVRSKTDLSIDNNPDGSIRSRVSAVNWTLFNTGIRNSIADGRQILRVNSVVGNYTYTFSCWNTQEGYDQFLEDVDSETINITISKEGITSSKETFDDWTIEQVINDIESIGGTIFWWYLPEPYKHMEAGTKDWE